MKIFVGNLNYITKEEDLKKLFQKFGAVKKAEVIKNKGFGFVFMENSSEAEKAVSNLNQTGLDGRSIRVEKAKSQTRNSKKKTPNSPKKAAKTKAGSKSASFPPSFVNPYNFVPAKAVHEDMTRPLYTDNSHFQDRFRQDTFSGRVVCEITTESEMFIGAGKKEEATEEAPAKIQPCLLNGKTAIPPTSLKGMLSSVMEAAGNSALRVLENRENYYYTRRVEAHPSDTLSSIGILREKGNGYEIEPLKGEYIYINRYRFDKSRNKFIISGQLKTMPLKDYSVDPVFYYARKNDILPRPKNKRFSKKSLKTDSESLIDESSYNKLSPGQQNQYIKGIIKHLGVKGRDTAIPQGKKHEFFIEYSGGSSGANIPVPDSVITQFNLLALEAFERDENFPFTPFGRHKSRKKPVSLQKGDVLYYREKNSRVDKVSFSAIWRDFCGNDKTENHPYGFFRLLDKNGFLLPPGLNNQKTDQPEKLKLTPASAMLGFVEEEKHKKRAFAESLAGRLYFSPGILSPSQFPDKKIRGEEKKLKILDSPKPPCPEFYFHDKNNRNRYIPKNELKPVGTINPNGRKFYWHHSGSEGAWVTEGTYQNEKDRFDQISRIEPVNKDVSFVFTIDFFNLTDFELGMLLYALKPDKKFRHQIGMGKPLGLGKVKIDFLNLLFVNRIRRYEQDQLFDRHFFHAQTDTRTERLEKISRAWSCSDRRKDFEKKRFHPVVKEQGSDNKNSIAHFVETFKESIKKCYGENWFAPLVNIGNPESTQGCNVRYPPDPDNPAGHDEAFRWWVCNSDKERGVKGKKAVLKPVPEQSGEKAPALPSNPGKPQQNKQ